MGPVDAPNPPAVRASLADVQHGGRVRLGDQAKRTRFEAWHCEKFKTRWLTGAPTRDMHNGAYAENYGPSEQQARWELWQAAWESALSAQPSPGGQDALSMIGANLRGIVRLCRPEDYSTSRLDAANIHMEARHALQLLEEALAARQPVGELVAIPERWALVDLAEYTVLPQIPTTAMMDAGWPLGEQITDRFDVKGAYADLIAEHDAKGEGIIHGPSQHPAQAVDLGTGVEAIAAERERQLQAEGFTRDGDQQYRRGELAKAATAYVQLAAMDLEAGTRNHIAWREPAAVWPWVPEWWKPVDARRDLVRSGALIAAQIDLIDSLAVGK
nr:hypothetical protein [Stenotrophomonas maltophilia]